MLLLKEEKTTTERQIGLNQQAGSRLMGRRDLKKIKKNVGHFYHGGISSRCFLQHRRHLRPHVIVSRSLSRSITQPPNLPSADE